MNDNDDTTGRPALHAMHQLAAAMGLPPMTDLDIALGGQLRALRELRAAAATAADPPGDAGLRHATRYEIAMQITTEAINLQMLLRTAGITRRGGVLTEAIVADCRTGRAAGETIADLARDHAVNPATLRSAVTGQTWRHVTVPPVPAPRGPARGRVLTRGIVAECRIRRSLGESLSAMAAQYDVTVATMHHAVTGRSWKHLPVPPVPPGPASRPRAA